MEVEEVEESQGSDEIIYTSKEEEKDTNENEPRESKMDKLQMEIIEAQRKLFRLQTKYNSAMTLSGGGDASQI